RLSANSESFTQCTTLVLGSVMEPLCYPNACADKGGSAHSTFGVYATECGSANIRIRCARHAAHRGPFRRLHGLPLASLELAPSPGVAIENSIRPRHLAARAMALRGSAGILPMST